MVQVAEEGPQARLDVQECECRTVEWQIRVQQRRNHICVSHSVSSYLILSRRNVAENYIYSFWFVAASALTATCASKCHGIVGIQARTSFYIVHGKRLHW